MSFCKEILWIPFIKSHLILQWLWYRTTDLGKIFLLFKRSPPSPSGSHFCTVKHPGPTGQSRGPGCRPECGASSSSPTPSASLRPSELRCPAWRWRPPSRPGPSRADPGPSRSSSPAPRKVPGGPDSCSRHQVCPRFGAVMGKEVVLLLVLPFKRTISTWLLLWKWTYVVC